MIASLAGYLIDVIVSPFLGLAGRVMVGIVLTTYIYVYARNWLKNLSGR